MILNDAAESFLRDKEIYCAPATVYYYRCRILIFLEYLTSKNIVECEQLNQDILKDFAVYLRNERGIKATSIHNYFRAVNNFILYLIENQVIPYFRYKIKLPRMDPDIVMPLTAFEAENIISAVCKCDRFFWYRDELIIRLMLDCGFRSSEVRNIKVNDVDLIQGFLSIRLSKYNKNRMLPLPDKVKDLIIQNINFYNLDPKDNLVSISKDGMKKLFQQLKRYSSYGRLHAHLLRHTFATSYMMQNGNIEYLRIYLGHSDIATTQKYVHIASECLLSGYDIYKIDNIFK